MNKMGQAGLAVFLAGGAAVLGSAAAPRIECAVVLRALARSEAAWRWAGGRLGMEAVILLASRCMAMAHACWLLVGAAGFAGAEFAGRAWGVVVA